MIVSGSLDNSVRIWSLESKSQEAILQDHPQKVNSVAINK